MNVSDWLTWEFKNSSEIKTYQTFKSFHNFNVYKAMLMYNTSLQFKFTPEIKGQKD